MGEVPGFEELCKQAKGKYKDYRSGYGYEGCKNKGWRRSYRSDQRKSVEELREYAKKLSDREKHYINQYEKGKTKFGTLKELCKFLKGNWQSGKCWALKDGSYPTKVPNAT